MRPFLEKECERLHIAPSVHFLGNISAVQPFYDAIDILLVPSIREPLGLVAQEAACRGCPVIATAVDGLCEVVQNEKTGFTIQADLSMKQYSEYSKHEEGLPDCVYDPLTDTLSEPKAIAPEMIAQKVALLLEPSVYELFSKQAIVFAAQRPNFDLYQKNLTALLQEFLV